MANSEFRRDSVFDEDGLAEDAFNDTYRFVRSLKSSKYVRLSSSSNLSNASSAESAKLLASDSIASVSSYVEESATSPIIVEQQEPVVDSAALQRMPLAPIPPLPFLRGSRINSALNSPSTNVICMAGCSETALDALKDKQIHELYNEVEKLPESDKVLLNESLQKNSEFPWQSSSLYAQSGIFKDTTGEGLSLLRLLDLLANSQEHLLIMAQEINLHTKRVSDARINDELHRLGFEDSTNCELCTRAMHGLKGSLEQLTNSIRQLEDTIHGTCPQQQQRPFVLPLSSSHLLFSVVGVFAIGSLCYYLKKI